MHVNELRISRYKSLGDVTLRPGALTALVGPNNAGKTNLVDAIDFIAEAYRFGLELAVARKGGFENIAHRKQRRTKSPLQFTIQADLTMRDLRDWIYIRRPRSVPADSVFRVQHHFEIAARGQGIRAAFSIARESCDIDWVVGSDPTRVLAIQRTGSQVKVATNAPKTIFWQRLLFPYTDASFVEQLQTDAAVAPTELVVTSRLFSNVLAQYTRLVATTRVYQLAPIECRRAGVPTPNPALDRHGGNLPAFVDYMRENASVWVVILDTMRRVMPGLEDIRTDFTEDRRVSLRFIDAGRTRPWTVDEVSDGTVQTLALLAALFDPRSEFVLLEEPENSVHPWILRNFVNAVRQVADKQIVLTTHSPTLINRLRPEEVVIVSKDRGETTARALTELDPEADTVWREGGSLLFDILDSGTVPQVVPGGPSE